MRPIQAGDLVMVVRWPCCGINVGKVAKVARIDTIMGVYCTSCRFDYRGPNADLENDCMIHQLACAPLSCLIRIDPPALNETTETEREITT